MFVPHMLWRCCVIVLGASRTFFAVAAVVVLSCLLAVRTSTAEMCAEPREQAALNASVLRTELMVAALSCGSQAHYNVFVTRFNRDLVEQGHLLNSFFQRQYGRRGEQELNRFITRLANEESQRSTAARAMFCADASQMFQQLLDGQQRSFELLVDNPALSVRHSISVCGRNQSQQVGGSRAVAAGGDLRDDQLQE